MEITTTERLLWLIPLVVWELYWKGHAMWKAAREHDKKWFWALLIINSVGLLPIYYLKHHKKAQYTPVDNNL